jgi:hypothetical protein
MLKKGDRSCHGLFRVSKHNEGTCATVSIPSNICYGTSIVTEGLKENSIEGVNTTKILVGGIVTSVEELEIGASWKNALKLFEKTPLLPSFPNVLKSFPGMWKSQTRAIQFATLKDLHKDLTSRTRW